MRREENHMKEEDYGKVLLWEKNKAVWEEDFQLNCKDTTIKMIIKMNKK